MNILVIAHFQDDNSPYVSFVHSEVLAFKKLGYNVTVISPIVLFKKYNSEFSKASVQEDVDGVTVYYPRYCSLSNYGTYLFNIYSGYFSIKKVIKLILKEQNIDIIHAHTIPFDGAIAVKLKKKFKIPVVITTHGSDTSVEIAKNKSEFLYKICNKADKVVAVSDNLCKSLKNINITTDLIYNGFNQKKNKEEAKIKHRIIQVSSMVKQKNIDKTICAFCEIKKEFSDAELVIIGDGPEKDSLYSLTKKLDVKVEFIDSLSNDQVLNEMAKSEIFIMPSINEGFGIVYLEAMYNKCVTIGTSGEGIDGVINDGENGILVPPNDIETIVKAIKKCFTCSQYTENLIENACETADKFSWDTNAKKYLLVYKRIIDLRRN